MSAFDASMAALCIRLLERFGGDFTLKAPPGSYNVETGRVEAASVPDRTFRGVLRDRKTWGQDGRLVKENFVLMTVKPDIGCTIVIGDTGHKVQSLEVVGPSGTAIVYRAVVKL